MAQIEESVGRYLRQLDSADRQEPSEAISIKTTRIKEKITRLKQEMSRLEVLDAQMRNAPDQQISLTDPDARSMATSGRGSGVVGYTMLDSLDEVEAAVSKATVVPRGTVRLAAPVWMANPMFARILPDYQARYPEVRLDVDLSGRMVNLVEEGFDLALRATGAPDEALIARPITRVPFYMVAAGAYLKRPGRPAKFADIAGHALLHYALYPGESFSFAGEHGTETVKLNPVLRSGNETLLHMAALEGMGLAFLPKWLVTDDTAAGRLVHILSDDVIFEGRLFAVYPSRKYLSAKVRTFIDFVAADKRMR